MNEAFSDNEARFDITNDLNRNFFIMGGAGAGKSTVLVKRVANMVIDHSVDIVNIAAITFTDRAAAELREKIREELSRGSSAAGESDRRRRAMEQLQEVDPAAIGTMHAFARQILETHALAARVPLGFIVVDESESARARLARARSVVEHLEIQLPELARQIIDAHGVPIVSLLPLIECLDEQTALLTPEFVSSVSQSRHQGFRDQAVKELDELLTLLDTQCTDANDLLAVHLDTKVRHLRNEMVDADVLQLTTLFSAFDSKERTIGPGGPIGSSAAWGGRGKPKVVRDQLKQVQSSVSRALRAPLEYAVRCALAIAWDILGAERSERASQGRLEFNDLLLITRDLLQRDPVVRKMVHDQYRRVIVDEFQDTDPVQWQIVRLVTSDPDDSSNTPLPGRLVVVGDPKQSIYAFRGAEIRTYLTARDKFAGETRELVTNFRSSAALVNWFNKVFKSLFVPDVFQSDYKDLVAVDRKIPVDAGPSITVLRDPEPENTDDPALDLRECRALEPRLVAESIQRAIKERWLVRVNRDQAPDKFDVCRYRDVSILLPTRTSLDLLLTRLDDAEVPYRSSDPTIVLARPATSGLIAALKHFHNPDDELSLWWALKSPLFGCSDDDLLIYRRSGGRWALPLDPDAPVEGRVGEAMHMLARMRSSLVTSQPSEALLSLIDGTRLYEVLAFTPRSAFDADCVRMLVSDARAWEANDGVGLGNYLKHADSLTSGSSRTGFDEPDDRDDDAVRVSTIHAAKGLEYPVVILAGMATERPPIEPKLSVTVEGGFEFKDAGIESVGYDEWNSLEGKPREDAELLRLLYVGCTRARDHLIVSIVGGSHPRTRASILRERVRTVDADLVIEVPDDIEARDVISTPEGRSPRPRGDGVLPQDWLETLSTARWRSSQPWTTSPSKQGASAIGSDSAPSTGELDSRFDLSDSVNVPTDGSIVGLGSPSGFHAGRPLGRAVHDALDRCFKSSTRPTTPEVEGFCERAALTAGIPAQIEEVVRRVRSALNSRLADEAFAAKRRYTELYLGAHVDQGSVQVIEGYADLVYHDGAGWVVVDFKTDSTLSADALRDYALQLKSYSTMLERATGEIVGRQFLLHLVGGSSDAGVIPMNL